MHERAWGLRKTLAGEDSLDAGQSLSNLATAHHALGEYSEADRYYKQARKVLAEHRETAPEVCEITVSNHEVLLEEAGDALESDQDASSTVTVPVPVRVHEPVRLTRHLVVG